MVRITTISNILSGIGIAILAFAGILKYLLESLGQTGTSYPFYAWIAGAVLLGIVVIASAINTFTEMTGFVHPEDKLFSGQITEAGEMGQVKEMTARFMLVSLLLGAVMAIVKVGLDIIWDATGSYTVAAGALGLFALVLVVLIVVFLGRKYEPVGE